MGKNPKKSMLYYLAVGSSLVVWYFYSSVLYKNIIKSTGSDVDNVLLGSLSAILLVTALWLLLKPKSIWAARSVAIGLALSMLPIIQVILHGGGVAPAFAKIVILPLLGLWAVAIFGLVVAIKVSKKN